MALKDELSGKESYSQYGDGELMAEKKVEGFLKCYGLSVQNNQENQVGINRNCPIPKFYCFSTGRLIG